MRKNIDLAYGYKGKGLHLTISLYRRGGGYQGHPSQTKGAN